MPITSTIQQGTLSLAAVTPGNSAIGDAAAAGTSASVARADHKHGREASGTPGASAVGDTASTGSATTVALSDHRHGREAFGVPVNIDASLTSLSTGSLTTVARADHVHTVSKVPVLIASTTLGSDIASYSFSSIPQTYYALECVYQILGTTPYGNPGENLMVRLNSDSGANYWQNASGVTNGTSAQFGYINTTSSFDSAQASGGIGYIWGYSNTTWYKTIGATSAPFNNSTTAYYGSNYISGYNSWRSTAAVTSITLLLLNGGNMKAGSTLRLYGIP